MPKVYLLIGIPGSGKSTYAQTFSTENNIPIISTDWVRAHVPNIQESEVWPNVYKHIVKNIKAGRDVIYDATSATPKVRKRLIDNLSELGVSLNVDYEIHSLFFPTAAVTCVNRVEKRNQMPGQLFLPLDCIPSYAQTIIPPTYEEGFSSAEVISNRSDIIGPFGNDSYHGYAFYLHDPSSTDVDLYECSGFANINTFEPVKVDSCFRLASVSKQFIAYGIVTLSKDNKLDLNEKLYDIFPNMPEYTKDITVKNMLQHTSGIPDYDEEIDHSEMDKTGAQVQDDDVLDWVRTTTKPYFTPGSKYQYSNTAYILLGLIIKVKSGKSIGEYLDEVIFKPFDMTSSKVDYEGITEFPKRAMGHIVVDGKLVMKDQYWCSATIGDGGIYSNINDLVKWLKVIENLEGPYLDMIKPNIIGETNTEYGYGLRIKNINGHEVIYHNGYTIGTNTSIGYIKDLGIEWAFLINVNNLGTDKLIEEILKKYCK